jgi:hypothetical protein
MTINQRVLRKANDDVRYVRGASRRAAQIEFPIPNALLQKASQEFLPMTQAFLHNGTAKLEIRLKKLMAARRSMHDVGGYAVLRQDHRANSLCGRPFLRSGGFSQVPRVYVESLQPSDKQVFLPRPIEVDRGAGYSCLFRDIVDRRSAVTELAKPLYRRSENLFSRILGFRPSMLFHTPMMPFSPRQRYQGCQEASRSQIALGGLRRNRLLMTYRLYCEALWSLSYPWREDQ